MSTPATCVLLPYRDAAGRCDLCGKALRGRATRWCSRRCLSAHATQHHWPRARAAARRRDRYRCTVIGCGARDQLEVNHIVPLRGAGYGWSCAHHVAGLELLCHSHHLDVTRAQRLLTSVDSKRRL